MHAVAFCWFAINRPVFFHCCHCKNDACCWNRPWFCVNTSLAQFSAVCQPFPEVGCCLDFFKCHRWCVPPRNRTANDLAFAALVCYLFFTWWFVPGGFCHQRGCSQNCVDLRNAKQSLAAKTKIRKKKKTNKHKEQHHFLCKNGKTHFSAKKTMSWYLNVASYLIHLFVVDFCSATKGNWGCLACVFLELTETVCLSHRNSLPFFHIPCLLCVLLFKHLNTIIERTLLIITKWQESVDFIC